MFTMLFDDAVQFAQVFSVECVYSFWRSRSSFVSWGPSDVLNAESRPIRDWKGRMIRLSQDIQSQNGNTKQLTDLDAHLV